MSAAEMAAESDAAASSGYASDARDQELSNGAPRGAIAPLEATGARRARSASEQKLIARGRLLLHAYQQKKRAPREEMCLHGAVSEVSAVEVLGGVANGKLYSNGHVQSPLHAVAAAASVDSDENWLAPSVRSESEPQHSAANERLLDAMEIQLDQLWDVLGDRAEEEPVIGSAREALSRLLEQKRIAESNHSYEETTHGHDRTVDDLRAELTEAKTLISELNDKVNGYRAQLLTFSSKAPPSQSSPDGANGHLGSAAGVDVEVKKLQVRVQEKEELLLSLRTSLEHVIQDHGKLDKELSKARATIERLEGEKEQMQKAASDKRTLLHRAYIVKAKQLDQLCKDVELPSTWERITDENGIIYYRQNDRACAPELEDPRVGIAIQRLPSTRSGSPSPRSAGGRMEQTAHARSSDRKYSSSSFDSTVSCEDIAIPPEDGTKHEVEDFETPLPDGWEMRVTTGGSVFFVNRTTNVTTWKDPRRMKRGSSMVKRSSAPYGSMASAKLSINIPERRASIGAPPLSEKSGEESSSVRAFDVVFEEKGPIGIHFQANTPDAGATVRRLLPRMAASRSHKIEPYDRLIAVNKNPVDNAPFRYVMLLLQGGLRPLTLTFERGAHARSSAERSNAAAASEHLDEEMVLGGDDHLGRVGGRTDSMDSNEPTEDSLVHRTRRSTSSSYSSASDVGSLSSESRDEDFSIADKIITNVFSLFWTRPTSRAVKWRPSRPHYTYKGMQTAKHVFILPF